MFCRDGRSRTAGWVLAIAALAVLALPATADRGSKKPAAGERRVWKIAGVDFAFRWIPPGQDRIGSPPGESCRVADREGQWTARFQRGFWMLETEVTQAQWSAVLGGTPSHFEDCPECPVEQVSWGDVQSFVRKLLSLDSGETLRLPREAEWEYAARAGSDGPFYRECGGFGSASCRDPNPCVGEIAWYGGNSKGKTHPVGLRAANAWGLRDMQGNVSEWCHDRFGDYPSGTQDDYAGPATGKKQVVRGGSYFLDPSVVRLAYRTGLPADYRSRTIGFRLVREAPK